MFLGSWEPSFDKNTRRIALPKKIREYLATSEIIVSFGLEKCLFGFDTKSWRNQSKQYFAMPLTDKSARGIRRLVFASATHLKLDDQGRFVIPGNLLKYAQIKRPIIIGAGDHFEIWQLSIWHKERLKLERQEK